MIQAGSKVRVTDWGKSCPTYANWFETYANCLSVKYIAGFAYGDSSNFDNKRFTDNTIYRVLFVADCKALIIRDFSTVPAVGNKTYLVEIAGLKECVDKDVVKDMLKSISLSELREIINEILIDGVEIGSLRHEV